jgi:hypothetical protein
MIQQYFKIVASRDQIMREILAFNAWPEWWPGVRTVQVIQADPVRPMIDLVVKTVATIQMTLQFDCSEPNAIRFRQTKGWFKSYQGEYTLLPTPDGTGTTVKITIELESGMMVPKGMVYTKLSATLGLLEEALNKRISAHAIPSAQPGAATRVNQAPETAVRARGAGLAEPKRPRRKLAHIFTAPKGLEVWVAGKPYFLRPIAP